MSTKLGVEERTKLGGIVRSKSQGVKEVERVWREAGYRADIFDLIALKDSKMVSMSDSAMGEYVSLTLNVRGNGRAEYANKLVTAIELLYSQREQIKAVLIGDEEAETEFSL
jgi:hypothetical protein